MSTAHQDTCPERVMEAGGWHSHRCNRPLKTDEQREAKLCGIHLGAKRRSQKKSAKLNAMQAESDAARDRAASACDALSALGLAAKPYYHNPSTGWGSYTGEVVVDGEALLRALEDKP